MEEYIHLQNLILFKKRLTEAQSDAEREVLLKLLADEEAKEFPQKLAFSSRVEHQWTTAQEAVSASAVT